MSAEQLTKAVSWAAVEHLRSIQVHIDNINKHLESTALTPQQRAAIEQRRAIYLELAGSALDLYKLIKAQQQATAQQARISKMLAVNEDLKSTLFLLQKFKPLKP